MVGRRLVDSLDDNNNDDGSILITNAGDVESYTYSLVLLKGRTTGGRTLRSTLASSGYAPVVRDWDVVDGEFKCLFDLRRGSNDVLLECGAAIRRLTLDYAPRRTNLRVTPVYVVCRGHDGRFQSPSDTDNSVESALARVSIGARLVQCLMAEKLRELGLGRKTFQLEHEVDPRRPECVVFRSDLDVNRARRMKESELWCHFGRELMLSELGSADRKFLAFISCTRFKGMGDTDRVPTHEEIVAVTEAHAALGGGGLAVFGSACLYTWPTRVDEIAGCFGDPTPVDSDNFMDDSCYRGTLGACFATTLGSVCHELGHAFDLGHTRDGIMGRGFDHVDRVFTVGERAEKRGPARHATVSLARSIDVTMLVSQPPKLGPRSRTALAVTGRGPNVTPITIASKTVIKRPPFRSPPDLTYWTRNCGVFLSYHRWFNDERGREREAITRYLRFDNNGMMILSTAGMRAVEVREETTGMVIEAYDFADGEPEKRFLLPFTATPKGKMLVVVVEDDLGNILKQIFSY